MFETERKFLVSDSVKHLAERQIDIVQGYLFEDHESHEFRIRITNEDARISIKDKVAKITRNEIEFNVPVEFAEQLLSRVEKGKLIKKTRYFLTVNEMEWSVDKFENPAMDFLLAEVELRHEKEQLNLPHWVLKEVTGDSRYYNYNLRSKG